MSGAGAALQASAITLLEAVEEIGSVHPGPPMQAVPPYAVVECGAESDWSHKTAIGRELRLTVTVRAAGERPDPAQSLADAAEAALEAGLAPAGWSLATLRFVRRMTVAAGRPGEPAWTVLIEYRARMLAA